MFVSSGENHFELTKEEIKEISFPIVEIKEEQLNIRYAVAFSKDFGNRRGLFTALSLHLNDLLYGFYHAA